MTEPLFQLTSKTLAEEATVDDWVTLIRAAYSPTPTIVPFAVEVFLLHCSSGKTFKQSFDRCAKLFVEGLR